MKLTLMLVVGLILTASVAFSQVTAPIECTQFFESDTTATTSWDSVYIGGGTLHKTVEFDNDGSVSLYVCAMNDTAALKPSSHKYHTVKTTEREFTAHFGPKVTFVRTKAASSTCSRRVKVWR